ncbi:hypothetical protein JXA47_15360 [Candidatus Sumerlaeota bacterium]|nr:hypothetical protein [Candidatus Sumerlaeota bacterium]
MRALTILSLFALLFPGALAQPPTLELVGSVGGLHSAVEPVGDLVYLGEGPHLVVFDVSDPDSPQVLNRVRLDGQIADMARVSDTLIVASEGAGVMEVDISDPLNPTLVGTTPTCGLAAAALAVSGEWAFVAGGFSHTAGQDFQVINLTTSVLITREVTADVYGLDVQGDFAYLGDTADGLVIFDVSDPSAPVRRGSYQTPGGPQFRALGVLASGELVYVADDTAGLEVVDVSDPDDPFHVVTLPLGDTVNSVTPMGVRLLLGTLQGMRVIDVSTPDQPQELGHWLPLHRSRDVVSMGDLALVALLDRGMQVVDISDEASPEARGVYEMPGVFTDLAVGVTTAHLGTWTSGLWVFDIADPENPSPLMNHPTAGTTMNLQREGDLLWVIERHDLTAYDVSNPISTETLGSVVVPTHFDFHVANGVACVVTGGPELFTYDISDPTSPEQVGFVHVTDLPPTQMGGHAVWTDGAIAYVGDGWGSDRGLTVFDISDPTSPEEVTFIDGVYGVQDILVEGPTAYVASPRLVTLDVSDPVSPSVIVSMSLSDFLQDQDLVGDRLVTAGRELWVLDVSDPSYPEVVVHTPLAGIGEAVQISGSLIHVVEMGGGYSIYRLSEPGRASLAGVLGALLGSDATQMWDDTNADGRIEAADLVTQLDEE